MTTLPKNSPSDRELAEISPLFSALFLVFLITLFIIISMRGMGAFDYSSDEMSDILIAKGRTLREVMQFSLYEAHPPLGNILRHYWLMLSDSIWFARSLALWFAVLMIPLYYFIGKELDSNFTGLCIAMLVAFSNAIIIQSFIVRNYTIFLLLLSLGFYCYLRWWRNPSAFALVAYVFFGILACLTNFSGIFTLACLTGYALLRACLENINKRHLIYWLCANALIAVVTCAALHLWQDTNAPFTSVHAGISLTAALLFPCFLFFYILPFPLTLGPSVFAVLVASARNMQLRLFCILAGLGLLLGMVLVSENVYLLPSRHGLWILPFILCTAGWSLADCCKMAVVKSRSPYTQHYITIFLLLLGSFTYSPAHRFAQNYDGAYNEYGYAVPQSDLLQLKDFLNSLGPNYLIIGDRGASFLLSPPGQNSYSYFSPDRAIKLYIADEPFYHTHLLVNTSYYALGSVFDILNNPVVVTPLTKADMLAFVMVAGARNPVMNLYLCPTLDKQTVAFPPLAPGVALDTTEKIVNHPASVLLISKKNLFEQVLSPRGKAHSCLSRDPYGR